MSKKLDQITAYQPDTDEYKIRADANESFIGLPLQIKENIADAIMQMDLNRYPDPYAAELCNAAADYYGTNPQNIAPGNGSDELIGIIINSFLQKNSRLCVCAPDFSMYNFYAHIAEVEVVGAIKSNLKIDKAELISKAKNADMLIFSNPCNPTGRALAAKDVIEIASALECIVVVDEAYMEFYGQSVIPYIGEHKNLIVLRTCSKALGLAAARVGFAISNPKNTQDILKAKSPYNLSSPNQAIAKVLLLEREYIDDCMKNILSAKKQLYTLIFELGYDIIDTDTNFVLLKDNDAEHIREYLAQNGVAVRQIMGDYLRITAASPQDNLYIVQLLKQFKNGGK